MDPSQGTSNPVARYAPTEYVLPSTYNCGDFTDFKDLLLVLRKSNDNIKFQLNKMNANTGPQCEDVWRQISAVSAFRRHAINDCLALDQARLDSLSALLSSSSSSSTSSSSSIDASKLNTAREMKRITQKMDLLRNEQDIEDILQRQAEKLFHRACPSFVFPS